MGDGDPNRGEQDEVEAVDFGPYFNDWLRESAVKVARMKMQRDESTLVVMAEGDDSARSC